MKVYLPAECQLQGCPPAEFPPIHVNSTNSAENSSNSTGVLVDCWRSAAEMHVGASRCWWIVGRVPTTLPLRREYWLLLAVCGGVSEEKCNLQRSRGIVFLVVLAESADGISGY